MAPFFSGEFIYRLQHEKKDGKVELTIYLLNTPV